MTLFAKAKEPSATVSTEIDLQQKQHQLRGLKAIGKVERKRETAEKTTTETDYYLLSSELTPERFNEVACQHRSIENRLHWRLDVVMNEDQDRTRAGNGAHNLALLRHMVLNALQKEGSKGSLRGKFKRAGWDDPFLLRLLEMF
jgi:predicted transposase YbfD/YdcC